MSSASQTYSIKALTKEFGVTARTLRHYEDQGLLSPRREGQNRVYSRRDRARLIWILRGRRVGFSLQDIGELLNLYDVTNGRRIQAQAALDKCRSRLEALDSQRQDIELTIRELQAFCRALEDQVIADADQTAGQQQDASLVDRYAT